MIKKPICLISLILCFGCGSYFRSDPNTIVSLQLIDRNGFAETISNQDRLSNYQNIDFLQPQPYQKVLRVYKKTGSGKNSSTVTSYHDNGQLWHRLEVVDGRAHGLYQEYYSNGQLKIEAFLIEGVADIHHLAQASWIFDNKSTVRNEQGQVVAEIFYDKGLLHTPSVYYYPEGSIKKIIPYQQGLIEGYLEEFDCDGNLLQKLAYRKGEKEGISLGYWNKEQLQFSEKYQKNQLIEAVYFDSNGKKIAEIYNGSGQKAEFVEGRLHQLITFSGAVAEGEVKVFHPNQSLHAIYSIKNQKKQGEEKIYYSSSLENPQIKLCLYWDDDKIQGMVKTWYPSGKPESQREFNQNKKQGTSVAWYENGDVMLIEEYDRDVLISGSYFKPKDNTPISQIEQGKGTATLYTSNGIFLKKISYEKGKPKIDAEPLLR
ncbi:MAG: hypothetical protein LBC45_04980 [Chlamydiales bacterium]|jgi:antitoxin component YwqK of YwqJK toxin-antitoxin module|nr:hypothetical protein [Chlamydiales bacterium]